MRQFYPEVVSTYEESIKKPPKEKKTRAKQKKDTNELDKPKRKYNKKVKKAIDTELINLSGSLKNLSISKKPELNTSKLNVSVSVSKLKRKMKTRSKGQKTIDSFIANKRRKSSKKSMQSMRKSFKNLSINFCDYSESKYQKENMENKNLLSMLGKSESHIEEIDLSDIIDNIVSSAPVTKTAKVDSNIYKLVFDKYSTPQKIKKNILHQIHNNCSTPKDSPKRRNSFKFIPRNVSKLSNQSLSSKVNTSYFFDKLSEDRDAFEISMEYKHKSAIISIDCDTTVDYSLPEIHV